jgi:hypothetical protein
LNTTFLTKRAKLAHANTDLLSLPSWYQSSVSKLVDLNLYQSELNRLESQRSLASTDEDYLNIANDLYNLAVPWAILTTERSSGALLMDYNFFDPSVIQEIFPSSVEDADLSLYKSSMFNWQIDNIESI